MSSDDPPRLTKLNPVKVSVGRGSRLSGRGKMNDPYLDVSGSKQCRATLTETRVTNHHVLVKTETRWQRNSPVKANTACVCEWVREKKYCGYEIAHAQSLCRSACVLFMCVCVCVCVCVCALQCFRSYQHWQQSSSRWQGSTKPRRSRQNKQRCQTGQWCALSNLIWPSEGME